ncbi:MAG TPA: hypothetical protein VM939_09550, partial [Gemmatimonadaceae bacterium]|nr:hypothetical protein [Gemmatimonadaceae bacterium]
MLQKPGVMWWSLLLPLVAEISPAQDAAKGGQKRDINNRAVSTKEAPASNRIRRTADSVRSQLPPSEDPGVTALDVFRACRKPTTRTFRLFCELPEPVLDRLAIKREAVERAYKSLDSVPSKVIIRAAASVDVRDGPVRLMFLESSTGKLDSLQKHDTLAIKTALRRSVDTLFTSDTGVTWTVSAVVRGNDASSTLKEFSNVLAFLNAAVGPKRIRAEVSIAQNEVDTLRGPRVFKGLGVARVVSEKRKMVAPSRAPSEIRRDAAFLEGMTSFLLRKTEEQLREYALTRAANVLCGNATDRPYLRFTCTSFDTSHTGDFRAGIPTLYQLLQRDLREFPLIFFDSLARGAGTGHRAQTPAEVAFLTLALINSVSESGDVYVAIENLAKAVRSRSACTACSVLSQFATYLKIREDAFADLRFLPDIQVERYALLAFAVNFPPQSLHAPALVRSAMRIEHAIDALQEISKRPPSARDDSSAELNVGAREWLTQIGEIGRAILASNPELQEHDSIAVLGLRIASEIAVGHYAEAIASVQEEFLPLLGNTTRFRVLRSAALTLAVDVAQAETPDEVAETLDRIADRYGGRGAKVGTEVTEEGTRYWKETCTGDWQTTPVTAQAFCRRYR